MVAQFYNDIARLPQISDQDMCTSMQQLSIQQSDEFDTIAALKELYIYVTNYKEQVSDWQSVFFGWFNYLITLEMKAFKSRTHFRYGMFTLYGRTLNLMKISIANCIFAYILYNLHYKFLFFAVLE